MSKKRVTTIGQVSFDELFAMLQSGEINQTGNLTIESGTSIPAPVSVEQDWAAMFAEDDDLSTAAKADKPAETNEEAETPLEFDFEPEPEPEAVLSIKVRNGDAKVYAPKDEPILPQNPEDRIKANAKAIKDLEKLNSANVYADEDTQNRLAAYTGWEGIDFKAESSTLERHFSDEEIEGLGALPMYPYSASEVATHALKKALSTIGFKTGNILIHGAGNGALLRALPKKMVKDSRLTIDATDEINSDINSFLFPSTEVIDNQEMVRESYYDVAIALVPVHPQGTGVVAGRRGQIELPSFACSLVRVLSAVRNGGFALMMIESETVDEMEQIHSPFNLSTAPLNFVGGLRLDGDAFGNGKDYDILVFNKSEKGAASDKGLLAKERVVYDYCNCASSYFVVNSENVIGDGLLLEKGRISVSAVPEIEQITKIDNAIKGWGCKGFYKEVEVDSETEDAESLPAYPNVKNFSMVVIGGEVYQRVDSRMVKQKLSGRALQRVKGMISIRNQARKIISLQIGECTDDELAQEQQKLNALYDAFVKEFGHLSTATNLRLFREDAEVTLLTALEYIDEEDVIHKADVFTKRTIKMRTLITSCDTPQEAYTICLDHKGCADVSYMASLCKMTEEEIIEEIGGILIFRDPMAGAFDEQWVAADEYLSGNVVKKLEYARTAAETSDEYEVNVKALEVVQPPLISAEDIKISLSSHFIDESYIAQFIYEVIGDKTVGLRADDFVFVKTAKGSVKVGARCHIPSGNPQFYNLYGTKDYDALWLIERLMNKTQIVAMKSEKDASGKTIRVKDIDTTVVILEKADQIETAFKDWIYADATREAEIVHKYNMLYNSEVVPKYDGSHLTFPGMTASIDLKQHQKNAVYRIIRDNGALIGHVVGAGKTITLLSAGMELKRLGRVSKPLYLVPNPLLAQWGGEMMRLYPTANILLAEPDDMRKHRRKRFLARMATGDYDAIILGSSSFGQIPAPADTVRNHVYKMAQKVYKAKFPEGTTRSSVHDMITPRMEEDILKTFMRNQTADYTLEELGVDYLFVDESHEFKNLHCGSTRGQIRGISNTGSAKCTDLYYKAKYLSNLHNGKGGFTFATGTAIVNSITELYSLQKYFQEDLLVEKNILSLDDWISLFGYVTSEWELPPEGLDENGGGFRQVSRVSSFKNVPELMKMVLRFMDCVTRDEIDMDTPDAIRKTVNCPPSSYQKEYMKELVERANLIRSGKVKNTEDNMLTVTVDGRKSALDVRIVNPHAIDSKTSKVSCCADNILDVYNKYRSIKGTQVIFSDISTPNQEGFNVYSALKEKLVKLGIPEDEIAFAHDFKSDKQRTTMRIKMQTGRLRVLIGSTATIGQGVNIQNRLIALHNLDVPWVPKDIDQREGRIIRPNNMNAAVFIFNYVTEHSFDAYMWQTIEVKAKLISQILRGDFSQRVIEDTDTKVLTYSEIKAIATGDTRFLKRAKLEGEIAKLQTLKRNFDDQKKRLKQDVYKNLPKTIESLNNLIPRIEKDIAALEFYADASIFECKGLKYDLSDPVQMKDAVKALPKSIWGLKAGDTFGTYNGMTMILADQNSWSSFFSKKELTVVLQGNAAHRLDNPITSSRRMLELSQRIISTIPKSLDEKKEKLRSNEMALTAATELVNEAFEQEELLTQLKEEYAEITRSLAA